MRKTITIGTAVAVTALALGACSSSAGDSDDGGTTTLVVSSDLPLQGSQADSSASVNNAIRLYLDQIGNKVGDYTIEFKAYDDSTAAKGSWDDATCAKNAQEHVANVNEVAVMGTYNSGCAKIIVPVLNQAPDGPMLMVSHGNTNPGLTKTWDPGEPEKFYPTGARNYARIVTTDDYQGAAAAQFARKDLGVTKCYIINDNQTYGQGVAKAFAEEAAKQDIEILGNEPWDGDQPNYKAFFERIKSKAPDCLYVAGLYDFNGGQLIKDKVQVLGDNEAVKTLVPDGFVALKDFMALPEADGVYLTFAGLDQGSLLAAGGPGADLIRAYEREYGEKPATSFALYGVAALQVILKAIEQSDGTRKGVNDAVFSGAGITIPASESVLGKDMVIDPASGDTNNRDITILVMKDGTEQLVKPWNLG